MLTAGVGYRRGPLTCDLAYQYLLPQTAQVGSSRLLSGEYRRQRDRGGDPVADADGWDRVLELPRGFYFVPGSSRSSAPFRASLPVLIASPAAFCAPSITAPCRGGGEARGEVFARLVDRPGEAHRRPDVAVARFGEDLALRAGQPLQARGGDADLEVAVDPAVLDGEAPSSGSAPRIRRRISSRVSRGPSCSKSPEALARV